MRFRKVNFGSLAYLSLSHKMFVGKRGIYQLVMVRLIKII